MNENDPSSKLTQEEFDLYRHVVGGRAEHMKKAIARRRQPQSLTMPSRMQ